MLKAVSDSSTVQKVDSNYGKFTSIGILYISFVVVMITVSLV